MEIKVLIINKQKKAHSNHLSCLAFSPDGLVIATGLNEALNNEFLKIWNANSGKYIKSL